MSSSRRASTSQVFLADRVGSLEPFATTRSRRWEHSALTSSRGGSAVVLRCRFGLEGFGSAGDE
ncbi:hypothetical protein B7P34_36395 [Streptosporangium nondiastaticum]|uniref:Uncharacterized protein n=1 Tax=Streptosporangium nondiastaticum TaxID=35764 RepID=A0A9X7JHL0_9ACTN|nr:hypothetical protein B7P34_36395 [Streptosporangium nondiastaticum]